MSGGLLTIDVGSELRSLSESQLRGTWQVPAELVRFALRCGARHVQVDRRGRGFVVRWQDGPIPKDVLKDLGTALDREKGIDERQRAISAVERAGAQPLLWAAGLRGARFQMVCTVRSSALEFSYQSNGRPGLNRAAPAADSGGVVIRWTCAGLDRRQAVKWLLMAVRFAAAEVAVDGTEVTRGFEAGLFQVRLDSPLPCRLGLTRRGDEPVLWLLQEGVVSARAGIPGYPPFEAAVELGGVAAAGSSAADLRRAVTPYLSDLVDRAAWLMVEVADRIPKLGGELRQRLVVLLLGAARRGLREGEVRNLPILGTAAGGDHLISVREIGELAAQRGGRLAVVDDETQSHDRLMDAAATVVASAEVRGLLAELIDVRFQSAPRRVRTVGERLRLWSRVRLEALKRRLAGLAGSRRLDERELSAGEKSLLEISKIAVAPGKVNLCHGRGELRGSVRDVLIPRENPIVAAAADELADNPDLAYPVLLALGLDNGVPERFRSCWRHSLAEK
jgi:hypothetical protein